MNKVLLAIASIIISTSAFAQVYNIDPDTQEPLNAANNFISGNSGKRVSVGAYAQIDYNQPLNDSLKMNGKMDVHRLVTLFGYSFSDKTYFVTEVEMEHVKEVYVEQAFLSHQIDPRLSIRAGLMLIPMGIINEYHEPVTYNGVERPNVDKYIVPTTWREIGAGFAGKFDEISLRYQLYAVNGFLSYTNDNGGLIRGADAYRKGRQKAAESIFTVPNLSTKVDYYGLPGLRLGLSGYFGQTQSTAYNELNMSDDVAVSVADSSVINVAMTGFDFRYRYKGWKARGQFIYSANKNTQAYNEFTGKDMGAQVYGWYGELSYNLLALSSKESLKNQHLTIFARYEQYDTHHKVEGAAKVDAYKRDELIVGIGWQPAQGAVLKADYQIMGNASEIQPNNIFNMGVGIWF